MVVFNQEGKLHEDVVDALYELGNVGMGMASIALGKILGVRVVIQPPTVMSVDSDVSAVIPDAQDEVAVGILMAMEQTFGGAVLFIVDRIFIEDAVASMTGRHLQGIEMIEDEESLSAVQELANIMAAACMKAIGSYTGVKIFLSPVMVGVDMVGALVAFPVAQLSLKCSKAICVDTRFSLMDAQGNRSADAGRIIMMPDEESVTRLMEALGM